MIRLDVMRKVPSLLGEQHLQPNFVVDFGWQDVMTDICYHLTIDVAKVNEMVDAVPLNPIEVRPQFKPQQAIQRHNDSVRTDHGGEVGDSCNQPVASHFIHRKSC